MRLRWVILPLLAVGGLAAGWALWPVEDQPEVARIPVPSGQPVILQEVINNERGPAGLTARFRFVAPEISQSTGGISFEIASQDMEDLCNTFALPRIESASPQPRQIIISLAEESTEFGVSNPNLTQFFEAYSIENGQCVWEGF